MNNVHPTFQPLLDILAPQRIDTTELDNNVASMSRMREDMQRQRISDEFDQWVTDIHKVRDAGPELLRILRRICAAETKPDLDMAITEGVTMVEKLPII